VKTLTGRTEAKAVPLDWCVDQGRRLEDRNRLDTVLVPAVNDADCGVCVLCMSEEKLEYMGSGDSMFARMKLKEIDGRTPQGVECAA